MRRAARARSFTRRPARSIDARQPRVNALACILHPPVQILPGQMSERAMMETLPETYVRTTAAHPSRRSREAARCLLHVGSETHAVLRLWEDGFAVDAGLVPRLRGAVEISRAGRDLWTCLIVASRVEDGMLLCEFKRISPVHTEAPVDYVRPAAAEAPRLPRA